jgi:hypothetical protein
MFIYFSKSKKDIQEKLRQKQEEKVKRKEKQLRQKNCGACRYFSYKCCGQKFCSCFCCLFCCSCCVPPGSNTRCFIWYCCCLGWRQTDFYKILSAIWSVITTVFYYLLCFPVWKCLWRLTVKTHEQHKQQRVLDKRRKSQEDQKKKRLKKIAALEKNKAKGGGHEDDDEDEDDIDFDNEFDETDFTDAQGFSRNPCPFPSTPFSTSNRGQSAAVYIIYTYDVLNIFMFIYTGQFLSFSTNIPFFGNVGMASGILVEIVIQILQVVMIGIKFYPILIVADAQPSIVIYGFATIYMGIIWISWFMKKAFCSRTEAFIKQVFKKVSWTGFLNLYYYCLLWNG